LKPRAWAAAAGVLFWGPDARCLNDNGKNDYADASPYADYSANGSQLPYAYFANGGFCTGGQGGGCNELIGWPEADDFAFAMSQGHASHSFECKVASSLHVAYIYSSPCAGRPGTVFDDTINWLKDPTQR
jgi:hypothetical protein